MTVSIAMKRALPALVVLLLFCSTLFTASYGATIASDSASDPAYGAEAGGSWKGTTPSLGENPPGSDNGGFGFQPWNFKGGYHDPNRSPYGSTNHFIDGVDFPASNFNDLGGPSFGLTNANQAYFDYTSRATRAFAEPLPVGATLSFGFDNPLFAPAAAGDTAGFVLRLNSGGGPRHGSFPDVREHFGFFSTSNFNGGRWNVADAEGSNDTGLAPQATSMAAQFEFTLLSATEYSFRILSLDGATSLFDRTGTLARAEEGMVDTLEILMYGNGSGNGIIGGGGATTGEREFFFNHLKIEQPDAALAGDYNLNGTVDAADYTLWRDGLNDGFSYDDYSVWKAHFGASSAGDSAVDAVAVPEPAAGIIAAVVWLLSSFWGARAVDAKRTASIHR